MTDDELLAELDARNRDQRAALIRDMATENRQMAAENAKLLESVARLQKDLEFQKWARKNLWY
jgi:hypothetical protein